MVPLSQFVDRLRIDLPGCIDALIERALIDAADEFCRKSDIWQYTIPGNLPLVATISEQDLNIPKGSRVVRLMKAYYNGRPLKCVTTQWLDDHISSWRTQQGDTPKYLAIESVGSIITIPVPSKTTTDGIGNVRVSLKPVQGATEIGDILWDDYREGLSNGALYRLKRMPNKEWSDPSAGFYGSEFNKSITAAWARAQKNFSDASLTVKSRSFI